MEKFAQNRMELVFSTGWFQEKIRLLAKIDELSICLWRRCVRCVHFWNSSQMNHYSKYSDADLFILKNYNFLPPFLSNEFEISLNLHIEIIFIGEANLYVESTLGNVDVLKLVVCFVR